MSGRGGRGRGRGGEAVRLLSEPVEGADVNLVRGGGGMRGAGDEGGEGGGSGAGQVAGGPLELQAEEEGDAEGGVLGQGGRVRAGEAVGDLVEGAQELYAVRPVGSARRGEHAFQLGDPDVETQEVLCGGGGGGGKGGGGEGGGTGVGATTAR